MARYEGFMEINFTFGSDEAQDWLADYIAEKIQIAQSRPGYKPDIVDANTWLIESGWRRGHTCLDSGLVTKSSAGNIKDFLIDILRKRDDIEFKGQIQVDDIMYGKSGPHKAFDSKKMRTELPSKSPKRQMVPVKTRIAAEDIASPNEALLASLPLTVQVDGLNGLSEFEKRAIEDLSSGDEVELHVFEQAGTRSVELAFGGLEHMGYISQSCERTINAAEIELLSTAAIARVLNVEVRSSAVLTPSVTLVLEVK